MTESKRISPARKRRLAKQFDAIARRLSYVGDVREQRLKHSLFELVMLLGGTGEPAAGTTTPPEGGVEGRQSSS